MNENYKILAQFIKDTSSETADVDTYLFVKQNISNYSMHIDISSKALKNKIIEVNIILRFEDKNIKNKRSHFEITYAVIIRLDDNFTGEKKLEKILLSDVPTKVRPNLENAFLSLIRNSGFPEIRFNKKIDFEKLYNDKLN